MLNVQHVLLVTCCQLTSSLRLCSVCAQENQVQLVGQVVPVLPRPLVRDLSQEVPDLALRRMMRNTWGRMLGTRYPPKKRVSNPSTLHLQL